MIRFEQYSDKGKESSVNQDAVFCYADGAMSIFGVADGMGGHMHGELASGTIVNAVEEWYQREAADSRCERFMQLMDSLEECLKDANHIIFRDHNRNGVCGSTVVVLMIIGDKYGIFSAGDSRVYMKRGFHFIRLTVDDVWQNRTAFVKGMKEEEIRNSEHFGKLTKAVGIREHIVFNRITGVLKKKDRFFLCCDGVYKCIPDKRLRRIFGRPLKIREEVDKAGAPDNYSFIIVSNE